MTENKASQKAGWNFDNSYARLPELFYTKQNPTPSSNPELIIFNTPLAEMLGLDAQELQSKNGLASLAGNQNPEGALPLAQAYAGHQFGHFNNLGDGRAVLLGEQITPQGERYDIQLKGSGRTPYSRRGDGRAALGPMLREYIISEAMYALGIPTTRSLSVVTTGDIIYREREQPGAILTRIAASHLRVGTFQFVAAGGTLEDTKALADYTLERHYPEIGDVENRYLRLFYAVIERQASLIASWQLVGFIHGVMNTDNMAISGETIDYGPCAFMDAYDPETVFSSIDSQSRYAYGKQPHIGGWNLARFAETLLPLFHEDNEQAIKLAEEGLSLYFEHYQKNWLVGMRSKLGIFNEEASDEALIEDLLTMMQQHKADYTNTFRALSQDKPEVVAMSGTTKFTEWVERWQARLGRQAESRDSSFALMQRSNPTYIPRNHRVEAALTAAVEEEDYSVMERLLDVLSDPFTQSAENDDYATLPDVPDTCYQTFCGT